MRPLPPHISVFCASKLPILGITKVKTCRSGPLESATMPRRPTSRNFLLSGGAGGAWQRRSPVSFQEAQRAQKPVPEPRDKTCRITHMSLTVPIPYPCMSITERDPSWRRRRAASCCRATRGTGVDCGVLGRSRSGVVCAAAALPKSPLRVPDCCGSI